MFAVQLKNALNAKGMSQAELARAVGCGCASISDYVRGDNVPRRDRLAKINEALGAKLSTARPITIEEVADGMGMRPATLRRGMKAGHWKALGEAVPSATGRRYSFRFFPMEVRRLVGID